jgi:adenylate cyclase
MLKATTKKRDRRTHSMIYDPSEASAVGPAARPGAFPEAPRSEPGQTAPSNAAHAAAASEPAPAPSARAAARPERTAALPIVEADATILLADIRGFTALMAAYPPPLMARLLNRFFTAMCGIVERYDGHVDKFMGDAVMAVFGVPRHQPDHLQRALACAAAMQHAMLRLNRGHQLRGEPALYVGIAINTGSVMAGSFGPRRHLEYTVIGDAVNLAARIESFSLRGQVLISAAAHAAARDLIEVGPPNHVRPKGAQGLVTLYPLLAVRHQGRITVPAVEPRQSPRVEVDLDAVFRQVEAKRLAEDQFIGRIRDLGYHGLSADLPMALPGLTELAILLPSVPMLQSGGALYARVLRVAPMATGFRTSLAFTVYDTPEHRKVKSLVDERLWGH